MTRSFLLGIIYLSAEIQSWRALEFWFPSIQIRHPGQRLEHCSF